MPVWFIAYNLLQILSGIFMGLITLTLHRFFDSIEYAVVQGMATSRVYWLIVALCAVFIMSATLNGVASLVWRMIINKVRGIVSEHIHEKMARIDPILLEDTRYHNAVTKASSAHSGIAAAPLDSLRIITFFLPYFIFMVVYLHNIQSRFVIAIAMVFIPVFVSQFIRRWIVAKFQDETAPINREMKFYERAVNDKEFFKETRILGAYTYFYSSIVDAFRRLGQLERKQAKRTGTLELYMTALSTVGYACIILMLVYALLAGDISAGAFAAIFTSIGVMFNMMEQMIGENVAGIARSVGTAQNYVLFMELPERVGNNAKPKFERGISAQNISFTYPGASNKSVDEVTLKINAGETIAIVGENGAGKTTLMRLLMGLYLPQEGNVELNGMDTADADMLSLYQQVSGVFQRYQRYEMTLRENVNISEIDSEEEVERALESSNIDMCDSSFPKGLDTMLCREHGGVELSGGQWQRVAIARGLYRMHCVIALDEPTAAIDPIEESRIYEQFISISRGKTAIIITHRLGSSMIADRIVVMDKGKVVDIGTHIELMQRKGLYAAMFEAQATRYK